MGRIPNEPIRWTRLGDPVYRDENGNEVTKTKDRLGNTHYWKENGEECY